MLAHMEPELQQQFENVEAHDMIVALKRMFEVQARTERFNVSRAILRCRLREGKPLSPHVIKMVGYMQSMDRLGFPVSKEFATDIILNSLPKAYAPFISNYHMHGMDKELTEMHGMLKTAEADIKRGANQVLMVHLASKIKKGSWSKRKKSKGGLSEGVPSTASVTKPAKPPGTVCYYCQEDGHWKRNCTKYLADKAKGGSTTSDSGTIVVNVIDI